MKTVCVYHSVDLDGQMSAAIVKHWFINGNDKVNGTGNTDLIDFIGYNYGQPIPDLSEYDKVIMCDISFPKEEMYKLFLQKSGNFIWVDHHVSAIKDSEYESFKTNRFGTQNENLVSGLRDTNFAACELTWHYFFPDDQMPEIVRLLGRYDCFGHKGTDEEQKVLEFQYGARQTISNYDEAYSYLKVAINGLDYKLVEGIWNDGKIIYNYLCTEAKQIYNKGFKIYFTNEIIDPDTTGGIDYQPYEFICINRERFNPVNFGIDYHKDGWDGVACFWYEDGKWMFSLYNDNGNTDCSQIAKQYGGGGHKGAAGFVCDTEMMLKIIS